MNGLHFLFIGIALSMMILVTGCNTPYITKDGERSTIQLSSRLCSRSSIL